MRKKLLLLIIALVGSLSIYAQLLVEIQITQPTCNNSYASATAIASGGVRPYTYVWSTGLQDSVAYGLMPSQSFSVTVTDANSESVVKGGVIGLMPQINISFTDIVNPHCYGECNGSVKAIITGGTEPYIYKWQYRSDIQGSIATGLCDGSINLQVEDFTGCISSSEISLTEPAKIELDSLLMIYPGCQLNNGQIQVNVVSGGITPFNFNWGGPYPPTPILSNLFAGNYSCTVTDNSGCKAKINVPLSDNGALISTSPILNHVSCNGGNNGSIYIPGVMGNLSWENGSPDIVRQNLSAGDYYLTVINPQTSTCKTVAAYTITQPSPIHIGVDRQNPKCSNGNGSIYLDVSGGTLNVNTPDYSYVWSNQVSTTNYVYELQNGTYSVTVNDANGCSAIASAQITQPNPITVDFTVKNNCFGSEYNGVVTFGNVINGNQPYDYHVDPIGVKSFASKSSSPIIAGLGTGLYYIYVSDRNGCASPQIDTSIADNPEILISEIQMIPADCNINNGEIIIGSVSGGTPNYTFEWSNNAQNQNLTALEGGSYILTITDAIGCERMDAFYITQGEFYKLNL